MTVKRVIDIYELVKIKWVGQVIMIEKGGWMECSFLWGWGKIINCTSNLFTKNVFRFFFRFHFWFTQVEKRHI